MNVVDCEDLPLNISRENYQDSGLISKLRNVLTRRVIKMIDDEAKRDPEKYKRWFSEFNIFLKEGIASDQENKDALFKLLRYPSRNNNKSVLISLDDYVSNMQEGQEKIYFIVNPVYEHGVNSPYMEPFKNSKLDVLVLNTNIDEILFQQNNDWKGKKFVNIESNYEDIAKDLGGKPEEESLAKSRIPEDDVSAFCIWMKEDLKE